MTLEEFRDTARASAMLAAHERVNVVDADGKLKFYVTIPKELPCTCEPSCEDMRPVFEAARAWRVGRDRNIIGTAPSGGPRSATGVALIDAVDAALAREPR